MRDQVEIERELASTQEALVYANKEKWKYKDRCVELENLLKECGEQLDEYSDVCLQEGYDIEREVVLKLKTKIDEALGVDK